MYDSLFYFVLCRNTKFNEDKDDSFGISLNANRITQASPGSSVLGSPCESPLGEWAECGDGGAGRHPPGGWSVAASG